MRVPFEWLREFASINAQVDDVASRLTDAGFEVETIHRPGAHWHQIFVAEVIRIDRHPNADRLNLPTVSTGDEEIQVVCGASNFKVGDKIALARPGAILRDSHTNESVVTEVKAAKIRGVVSPGMLCSARELGLSSDHDGILILDTETPIGQPLAEVIGDEVIEFELKANRADALSVLGIAREAAALYDTELRSPIPITTVRKDTVEVSLSVQIEDPALCSRYSVAYLTDIKVTDSPEWLKKRLELAGTRPINTIVDVTNYVMLELGLPLHAFDRDTLNGTSLGVRTARPGERLVTLDGQDRELTPETLCIVDSAGPIALAGVMGGLDTEVTEQTTTVVLEAACFDPISVRRTAHRLALRSEASRRFEKGLPPEMTAPALQRCVQLIEELGVGRGNPLSADAYPNPNPPTAVVLEFGRIEHLLGVAYDRSDIRRVLTAIGFDIEEEGGKLHVTPPVWRRDVTKPADVIEEIARLIGYDRIPETLPVGRVSSTMPNEIDTRDDDLRDVLVGLGFAECVTYALSSEARLARLLPPDLIESKLTEGLDNNDTWNAIQDSMMNETGRDATLRLLPLHLVPVRLQNPLSQDESVLRVTGLATMLETLGANRRHTDRDLLLFELQPVFLPRAGDLPEEPLFLTAVLGERISSSRWNDVTIVTLPFLRGIIDELFVRMRIDADKLVHKELVHPTFAPGSAAAATLDGHLLAIYGEIDPKIAEAFDLQDRGWALIIDVEICRSSTSGPPRFVAWSNQPSAPRDLAIEIDVDVPQAEVIETIRRAGQPLLQNVRLFDEYRGDQISDGKRSLAYALRYGSADRTLTDNEADKVHARVVRTLKHKLGAKLRT